MTRSISNTKTEGDAIIARLEVIGGNGSVCVERFEDYPQLGRFTLRDQVSIFTSRKFSFCPASPMHNHSTFGRRKLTAFHRELQLPLVKSQSSLQMTLNRMVWGNSREGLGDGLGDDKPDVGRLSCRA